MRSDSGTPGTDAPARSLRLPWWALALPPLAALCWGPFHWMIRYRWFHGDGLYEHAPLLFAFGAWILWRDWKVFTAPPRDSSPWGLPVLGLGVVAYLAGVFLYRDSLCGFALIPILAGLLLVDQGGARTRRLLPLVLLLLFAVPLPDQLLKAATFPMKMASTRAGTSLAAIFLDGRFLQAGTEIYFPGQARPLVVGDACSGMRSAIALLTLGYCLAFFFGPAGPRRWILLMASLPAAFLANAVRIAVLCLLASRFGVPFAAGRMHTFMGYVLYLTAFLLLLGADFLARRLLPGKRAREEAS
ncbi:MAG TPA: exosortase/archaeosortase family protein [Planctomycetes bacterium]|nr:exosortase/archaeosortase family protein [Planctomycetota bacterium]